MKRVSPVAHLRSVWESDQTYLIPRRLRVMSRDFKGTGIKLNTNGAMDRELIKARILEKVVVRVVITRSA